MQEQKSTTIGITGGSGSGKTSLIRDLRNKFSDEVLCILSQDEYYKDRDTQEKDFEGYENFDRPSSLDLDAFQRDFENLQSGKPAQRRRYFYNNPAKEENLRYRPAPIIIVEGLFIHARPALRNMIDYLIFMQVDEHLKLIRRIKRDRAERNYSLETVLHRYENHVMPSYQQHIAQLLASADLVINNNDSYGQGLKILSGFIEHTISKNASRGETTLK